MIKIAKLFLLFSFCILCVNHVNAQLGDIGAILSGAKTDAAKLVPAYLQPYANAFGADLSSGWFNTARPHKLLGFDLTLSAAVAVVPSSDNTFNLTNLQLTGLPGSATTPTIAGPASGTTTIKYYTNIYGTNYELASFKTPSGLNNPYVPAPILQLGIGLIKGTEVDVRYMPQLNIASDLSVQLWGVGIKHSIKQWIPGISMAPFFHLSIFGGYTQFKTSSNLSFQPSDLATDLGIKLNSANITPSLYQSQQLQMTVSNLTGSIVASFDLPVVTFYGAVGLSYTSINLKVNGTYPGAAVVNNSVVIDDNTSITNPINASLTNLSGSPTKPRINAGIKFTFAVITLHVDYTLANYSVLTAGLGISFR